MPNPYGRLTELPQAAPRIQKIDGKRLHIQTYDSDNGYPQRMESLIKASPTAADCVKVYIKYIIGNGCKDLNFYKAKVSGTGLTPDKLLRRIVRDKAYHNGFAVHVNYNALYQVESVSYVPFKNCRIASGDKRGRIAIHPDWYNGVTWGRWASKSEKDIDYIWLFNPDPVEIQRQVDFAGGWDKYEGQIYWYSEEFEDYPLSPYDEVIDPMITEAKSNTTTKRNIENNFQAKNIWVDIGEIEDDDELEERKNIIRTFMGPDGNSVIRFESKSIDQTGKPNDIPLIVPIENKLDDKIFQYSDDKTRGQIYRASGQNAVLHSDLTQGRYNQNQLPESQQYYNTFLTSDKLIFEEAFREIFSIFKTPVNPSNDYTFIPIPIVNIPVVTTDAADVTDIKN